MMELCKNCKHFLNCSAYVNSSVCDFFESLDSRKKYVLLHFYVETGFYSIIAFSDDYDELDQIRISHPHFGSFRHFFEIRPNDIFTNSLHLIKDACLLHICENVAQYLSFGEFAMFKKSYFKASSWFEKAKNSASFASEILDNY